MLLVLKLPVAGQAGPVTRILVQILIDEVEAIMEADEDLPPQANPQIDTRSVSPAPAPGSEDAVKQTGSTVRAGDWYALIPQAAGAAVDKAAQVVSVNPSFDEKRRYAAVKFAASKAPHARPIWENVEKDALGRPVLWSGDCYRVLDDPNAGSRDAFETFGQYIATCIAASDAPQELPWVSEIRNRRASPARSVHRAAE